MKGLQANKKFYAKWFLQIIFVFIAFMPCAVKNSFFASNNVQVAKMLNVNKVHHSTASVCSAAFAQDIVKTDVKIQRVKVFSAADYLLASFTTLQKVENKAKVAYSSNAPPFYILYQRLKIYDLA